MKRSPGMIFGAFLWANILQLAACLLIFAFLFILLHEQKDHHCDRRIFING